MFQTRRTGSIEALRCRGAHRVAESQPVWLEQPSLQCGLPHPRAPKTKVPKYGCWKKLLEFSPCWFYCLLYNFYDFVCFLLQITQAQWCICIIYKYRHVYSENIHWNNFTVYFCRPLGQWAKRRGKADGRSWSAMIRVWFVLCAVQKPRRSLSRVCGI